MDKGQQLRSKLTPNQITFCQGIADGLNQSDAYRKAYPKCSEQSLVSKGSRLVTYGKVKDYIEYLRGETEQKGTASRIEKREILAGIMRNEDKEASKGEVIQAVKVDNQMTGDDAPVRVEGEITLNSIMKALENTTGLPNE